jgi:hypothetical protein
VWRTAGSSLALVAATALLVGPPAASAATPFTVATEGFADMPNAAIDAAGNAHIAWRSGPGGAEQLRYCTVVPGATGCAPGSTKTLATNAAGVAANSIHVFVTPAGNVVVSADLSNSSPSGARGWIFQSTDGGATFDAGAPVTPVVTGNRPLADAALGPGDAISFLNELGAPTGPTYVRGPLSGVPPAGAADLNSLFANNFTIPDGEQVAVLADSRPVVTTLDNGRLEYAYYGGAGDVNDQANWVGPVELHPTGTDLGLPAMLAGGPQGVVLVYETNSVSGANDSFVARKLDPASLQFAPAVALNLEGDPVLKDFYADPLGGGFSAIYLDSSSPRNLRWIYSTNGVGWTQPLLLGPVPSGLTFANVAAGPAATGVVVWRDAGQSGNGDESIMAMRLEPTAEPGGDPCLPPNCFPEGGNTTGTVGNEENTVEVEVDCTTKKVIARVRTRKLKKLGKAGQGSVVKVGFKLDTQKTKTDKKRPWKVTFPLQAVPGGLHTLKAKLFIDLPNHKHKKLKLSKKFRACGV